MMRSLTAGAFARLSRAAVAVCLFWLLPAHPADAAPQQKSPSSASNATKVDEWLQPLIQMAEDGDVEAQYFLGGQFERDGNNVEAVKWYRRAADKGLPQSQRAMGVMYNFGQGVEQDFAMAAQWYLYAVEGGDEVAENNLGVMYQRGIGVPVDYFEAVRWYERSANHGHMPALANLGTMYIKGLGVEKDTEKGVRMVRQVAEEGDPGAMADLAAFYHFGDGVPEDQEEALNWCRRAAVGGHPIAAYTLAQLYFYGEGVPVDRVESLGWLIVANQRLSTHGDGPETRREYATSRDELIRALSREQVEEAQRRAARILSELGPQ